MLKLSFLICQETCWSRSPCWATSWDFVFAHVQKRGHLIVRIIATRTSTAILPSADHKIGTWLIGSLNQLIGPNPYWSAQLDKRIKFQTTIIVLGLYKKPKCFIPFQYSKILPLFLLWPMWDFIPKKLIMLKLTMHWVDVEVGLRNKSTRY